MIRFDGFAIRRWRIGDFKSPFQCWRIANPPEPSLRFIIHGTLIFHHLFDILKYPQVCIAALGKWHRVC